MFIAVGFAQKTKLTIIVRKHKKATTPSEWTQPWGGCAERYLE
jgi:hypothetical protein